LILVTGATGHIGHVLVHQLSRHYPNEIIRVFLQPREILDGFDRLTLQLFYGDIRKAADVSAAVQGARLVFHLAGLIDTSLNPGPRIYEINIGGTRHVVEACQENPGIRLVYVSSVHALPDWKDGSSNSLCRVCRKAMPGPNRKPPPWSLPLPGKVWMRLLPFRAG